MHGVARELVVAICALFGVSFDFIAPRADLSRRILIFLNFFPGHFCREGSTKQLRFLRGLIHHQFSLFPFV